MNNDLHFSSKKSDWQTPSYLFDYFNERYKFTLDPCASDDNHLCEKYYTIEQDGLAQSWEGERVFMNPPYGKEIGKWVKKAHDESKNNCLVIAMLPARTCTDWFHKYCAGYEITFLKRRIKFIGCSDNGAPFPSMVVKFSSWGLKVVNHGIYDTLNHRELINRSNNANH